MFLLYYWANTPIQSPCPPCVLSPNSSINYPPCPPIPPCDVAHLTANPDERADLTTVLNYLKVRGVSLDAAPWSSSVRSALDDEKGWIKDNTKMPPEAFYPSPRVGGSNYYLRFDQTQQAWNITSV
jgi:hypothetical protein